MNFLRSTKGAPNQRKFVETWKRLQRIPRTNKRATTSATRRRLCAGANRRKVWSFCWKTSTGYIWRWNIPVVCPSRQYLRAPFDDGFQWLKQGILLYRIYKRDWREKRDSKAESFWNQTWASNRSPHEYQQLKIEHRQFAIRSFRWGNYQSMFFVILCLKMNFFKH